MQTNKCNLKFFLRGESVSSTHPHQPSSPTILHHPNKNIRSRDLHLLTSSRESEIWCSKVCIGKYVNSAKTKKKVKWSWKIILVRLENQLNFEVFLPPQGGLLQVRLCLGFFPSNCIWSYVEVIRLSRKWRLCLFCCCYCLFRTAIALLWCGDQLVFFVCEKLAVFNGRCIKRSLSAIDGCSALSVGGHYFCWTL